MPCLSPRLPAAMLALLCAWQVALPLAFFLQLRLADLPRLPLGSLARSAIPLYAAAGVLLWIAAHELAHAVAARYCGVQGGRIQWSPLLLPAFRAPPQRALDRGDARFLIYIAGPVLDLLCSLTLAAAAMVVPAGTAMVLQSLFIVSLLVGLPNCSMLARSDMGQGMRAFRLMYRRRWPSVMYGILSFAYAGVVIAMVAKLILRSRPGIV